MALHSTRKHLFLILYSSSMSECLLDHNKDPLVSYQSSFRGPYQFWVRTMKFWTWSPRAMKIVSSPFIFSGFRPDVLSKVELMYHISQSTLSSRSRCIAFTCIHKTYSYILLYYCSLQLTCLNVHLCNWSSWWKPWLKFSSPRSICAKIISERLNTSCL